MPPDRDLMRRNQIPAVYVDDQPSAFNKFLNDIQCDVDGKTRHDANALRQLILEILGYCVVTNANYEQCFILCGSSANGKIVLRAIANAIVDQHHIISVEPKQIGSVFLRSNLEGKLLNLVTMLNQNTELEDGMFKAVILGEMMSVERKHQNVREIEQFTKHIILTNNMLRIRDYSDGLFRRVSVIPLEWQFMGADADPHLFEN